MMFQLKSLSLSALSICALSLLLSAQGPPGRGSHPFPPGSQGEPQREGGRGPGMGRGPGGPPPEGERGPNRGMGRGPGGPPPNFIAAEMFSDGKVVKGQPYSATAVTEKIQLLGDGTRISHKNSVDIYRDGEGRTRRETKDADFGPFPSGGKPLHLIFINDPTANVSYVVNPEQQTANKNFRKQGGPPPDFKPRNSENAKTESLGTQTIEGVEAEGTRTTISIPVGEIGNDRPIDIVSERWESPSLQVVVLSKHKDPRNGETIYRLTNINRAEPAHSLFEVPSNYTVKESKFFGRDKAIGPPPQDKAREGERRKRPDDE